MEMEASLDGLLTEFISDGIRAGFEFTYPSGNFNIHWNCFTQIGNVGTIIGSLK